MKGGVIERTKNIVGASTLVVCRLIKLRNWVLNHVLNMSTVRLLVVTMMKWELDLLWLFPRFSKDMGLGSKILA